MLCAVLWSLVPQPVGYRPEPSLVVLALIATPPFLIYAWERALDQRHNVPPADAHTGLGAWAAMAAAAVALVIAAWLVALRPAGYRITAICVSGGIAASSLVALVYTHASGHEPRWLAACGLAWAVTFLSRAEISARRRTSAPAR